VLQRVRQSRARRRRASTLLGDPLEVLSSDRRGCGRSDTVPRTLPASSWRARAAVVRRA
jgi:hypothetical protein